MTLNDQQIAAFHESGYLFFAGLLDEQEVRALKDAVPDVLSREGPEVVREKDDPTAARLAFGAHTYSEPFERLARLPRLMDPVRQLLEDEVYLHQTRMNPKQGFGSGASWTWHQDFPSWYKVDGMPEPNCIMASVFIDDCTPVTSPLLIIPGSHRWGLLESELHKDAKGRGYDLFHIDQATLQQLADENGIEPLIGPAGSVALIHSNIVHGSADNVSPWRRAIFYLIYNAVGNACTREVRPWYQNNRDFTPLEPIGDDGLRTYSAAQATPAR
ncbi:MAG: phytanoyl-CoA dioxygenase family protein [Gemmatimonadota bacterium]|nr:phytanoyl-CoA dioxygenase family protein [Gemmatimonadota bacterium]